LGKQYLALEGPIFTSFSGCGLIRDVGTDIEMDMETVIEWLLPYCTVPIAAKRKLPLGHKRMEVVRDRRG
jgi:hypothetical protein